MAARCARRRSRRPPVGSARRSAARRRRSPRPSTSRPLACCAGERSSPPAARPAPTPSQPPRHARARVRRTDRVITPRCRDPPPRARPASAPRPCHDLDAPAPPTSAGPALAHDPTMSRTAGRPASRSRERGANPRAAPALARGDRRRAQERAEPRTTSLEHRTARSSSSRRLTNERAAARQPATTRASLTGAAQGRDAGRTSHRCRGSIPAQGAASSYPVSAPPAPHGARPASSRRAWRHGFRRRVEHRDACRRANARRAARAPRLAGSDAPAIARRARAPAPRRAGGGLGAGLPASPDRTDADEGGGSRRHRAAIESHRPRAVRTGRRREAEEIGVTPPSSRAADRRMRAPCPRAPAPIVQREISRPNRGARAAPRRGARPTSARSRAEDPTSIAFARREYGETLMSWASTGGDRAARGLIAVDPAHVACERPRLLHTTRATHARARGARPREASRRATGDRAGISPCCAWKRGDRAGALAEYGDASSSTLPDRLRAKVALAIRS